MKTLFCIKFDFSEGEEFMGIQVKVGGIKHDRRSELTVKNTYPLIRLALTVHNYQIFFKFNRDFSKPCNACGSFNCLAQFTDYVGDQTARITNDCHYFNIIMTIFIGFTPKDWLDSVTRHRNMREMSIILYFLSSINHDDDRNL